MILTKRLTIILLSFCAISSLMAQKAISYSHPNSRKTNSEDVKKEVIINNPKPKKVDSRKQSGFTTFFSNLKNQNNFFNSLDIATTFGTTGFGVDLSTPVGDYVNLRAGFSYMPRFEVNSTFRVQVGDSLDSKFDAAGNRVQTKFDKLSGYLKTLVGYDVDDEVDMICKPTYYNFKLLVDVFPFRNKRWHLTAGFFAGPAEIARAYNTTAEMPTLLSVGMWNMFYDKASNSEPIYGDFHVPELENKVLQFGRMGFHAGDHLQNGPYVYVDEGFPIGFTEAEEPIYGYDDEKNPILRPVLIDDDGQAIRAYRKGDPYMMVPEPETGMVKAVIKVNRFKPYVGFGYGGAISKDKLTQLSFDAGVMFWGGTPSVITHDGTDLTKDVENVKGKLGRYVDTAKFFKVFPVLEVRISRRIF